MGECKVLYRPQPDVRETARKIIDDVLAVQSAAGSMFSAKGDVEKALCSIQRQARVLLIEQPGRYFAPLDGLVHLVTRMERGEEIPAKELKSTLVALDVAAAKIRNHLQQGAAHGVDKPAA